MAAPDGPETRIATCGDESRITSSASSPAWATGHGGRGAGGGRSSDGEWRAICQLRANLPWPRGKSRGDQLGKTADSPPPIE